MGRQAEMQYLDTLSHMFTHGMKKDNRTGTSARSIFVHQMRFELAQLRPTPNHQGTNSELQWRGKALLRLPIQFDDMCNTD